MDRALAPVRLHALEERLARLAGVGAAVGCANGTDALQLALRAAGVGAGDRPDFAARRDGGDGVGEVVLALGVVVPQSAERRSQGRPVSFVIGTDGVMPGWNEGVVGMKPGGSRMLLLPPAMAFGERQVEEVVPANAPMMFRIELVSLEDPTGS